MFLVIFMLVVFQNICIEDLPIVMDEVMVTQAIEYILKACTGWIAKVARKERRGLIQRIWSLHLSHSSKGHDETPETFEELVGQSLLQ
jgi:hypothetical protein